MATLDDYKTAQAEFDSLNARFENYSGNNPNKYRSSIRSAGMRVRAIEAELKAAGTLPRTPQEELEARLDAAFPKARSNQVVDFEGRRFMRRFTPLTLSTSGKTVQEWNKFWVEQQS